MRAMYYYYKASPFTRIYYVPLILLASIEHAFRIFLSFFLSFFETGRNRSKKRNESADLNEYPRYVCSINYSKADLMGETLIRFVQLEPATVILGETDRDGRSIRPRTVCSTVDVNRQ